MHLVVELEQRTYIEQQQLAAGAVKEDKLWNARFPMEFLRANTRVPNVSHAGSKAMDFGGKGYRKEDPIYALLRQVCVRVRKGFSSRESYFRILGTGRIR